MTPYILNFVDHFDDCQRRGNKRRSSSQSTITETFAKNAEKAKKQKPHDPAYDSDIEISDNDCDFETL